MGQETRSCQNCKQNFTIDEADFAFYEKIKVPPPTWCPECRMIRRFLFRNERRLFRRKDDVSGKEVFSGFPAQANVTVYDHDYWWSDKWDSMNYGREYDFTKPFFAQFQELILSVPLPSRSVTNLVDAEYCNFAGGIKNAYLCFDCASVENSAYMVSADGTKDSFDLYQARHSELCYENYMSDECYRVFFSVNVEESTDIWFSKNMLGCSNCFGCVNLRNKSYYIFNKPYTKDAYFKQLKRFDLGSFKTISELRVHAYDFWKKFPMRFTLAIGVVNSTGEHIEKSKNLKLCYSAHAAEDVAYSQFMWPPINDSYDVTHVGDHASRMHECLMSGIDCADLKYCWDCWPSSHSLEYSAFCRSSSDLFGCVGLKKKQYCIFNKQYSKEDYFALREKIIRHMNEQPHTDKQGKVYKYGEFFPPEFSPFAYNETTAQDFFTLSKAEAESKGFLWREPERREYEITKKSSDLPDNIKDVDEAILKEAIGCASCGSAYRIIPMELDFYRKISLPLPRLCPDCRFRERFKFVNPPKWWRAACQCAGQRDDRKIYQNTASHPTHKPEEHCPVEFETSYAPGRSEIIYCEECYKNEVV